MTRSVAALLLLSLGASCVSEEIIQATETTGEAGESAPMFCPQAFVSRADMARYLERMKRGRDFVPPPAKNIFADVPPDSQAAAWIEQLAADGITRGTSPGRFSPWDSVPREQMAAFIIRLIHGPDFQRGGPSRFVDVSNPDFIGYIEQLADDGITKGCTATEFCPGDFVPREQMAAFLMRALHPGTEDPRPTGVFADVPSDSDLGGRVEQAVAEGIMEPCGRIKNNTPVIVAGDPSFKFVAADGPGTLVASIPRNVTDHWAYVTTRWAGAPWTSALCPSFTPFSVDVWLHVLSSDNDSAHIGELEYVLRPDPGGFSMLGPQISLWDTRGTNAWFFNDRTHEELSNPSWVTFDVNTRFYGPSFAAWAKVGGANQLDNGHCGAFLYVLARMVD
ncbi:MAG: S-layer homology domain-containing protein [Myxococcota bacterium]|nr:S-layer homology domain-containing protein [Myxococcota bacterium]